MKPRVVMMNKLKLDLARSLSSSGSVSTSLTSTFSTLSSYTSLTSLTLKTTADMSSALLIKKKLIEVHGKYWKHSREVLEDEVEGCDVEKVKTEHNEFEEEELQNHQAQF